MKNFCFYSFLFVVLLSVLTVQAADMEVRFCLFQSSTGGDVDWEEMFPANVPVIVVLSDGTEIPGMTGTLHPPEDARTMENPAGWGEVCVPAHTQSVDLRVTYAGETKIFKGVPARPNRQGGANYLIWDESRVILDEGAIKYWNEKGTDLKVMLSIIDVSSEKLPAEPEPVPEEPAAAEVGEPIEPDLVDTEPASVEDSALPVTEEPVAFDLSAEKIST